MSNKEKAARAVPAGGEPLFILHCGQIDSSGEQNEWQTEANGQARVDEFARRHPGQKVKLYAAPPQVHQPLTPADLLALIEEAFYDGFTSPETYNDTLQNNADDAWAKVRDSFSKKVAAALAAPQAEPTWAPLTDAQLTAAERTAFASTNETPTTGLCRYWYRKGLQDSRSITHLSVSKEHDDDEDVNTRC